MTQVYHMAKRRVLTERVVELTLTPDKGEDCPAFEPGAHIRIQIPDGSNRAYSLVSWPNDGPGALRIAVQREPDGQGGSVFVHSLTEDTPLTASAPECDFPVDTTKPAVLLAGGIGITPIISMATALHHCGQSFALHYSGRNRAAMAYADDLILHFGDTAQIYTDDETPLDMAAVIANLGQAHLYICGPKGFIDAARSAAEQAGVSADRVHVELFTSPEAANTDTPFEVEIASTGQVVTIPTDQTIVEALEEAGVDVMYDCQRGDCGICQTTVISGEPDHRDVVLSEAERAAGDVIQICVSRAKSARLVLDI